MQKISLIVIFIFCCSLLKAQEINPDILSKTWSANWIDVPHSDPHDYGIYHFRKKIILDSKPAQFIIHVSADNRYKLFVNGQLVSIGPAKGDLYHWNFETLDIAPFLKKDSNVIAAVVWNFGFEKPVWQTSFRTAFILQGNTKAEEIFNTDASWKCLADSAYSPLYPQLIYSYYAAGATEKVNMNKYPVDWKNINFDDSKWSAAHELYNGIPKYANNWSSSWMLVPRQIPLMELTPQRLHTIRIQTNIHAGNEFLEGNQPVQIAPNTTAHLLLDQQYLTNAFPVIQFSKGKDADIQLTYAEALYIDEPDNKDWRSQSQKGDRNVIEGKHIVGVKDEIISNGGDGQSFTSLSFRTYRYIALDITTKDEALTINDFYGVFTGYPFKMNATFSTTDTLLKKILEVGWRTARLDAYETYMDCPYYEQLQYIGDSRIQALVSLYNSGDDRLMRNAIEQIANSTLAEGLTESRFPHNIHQEIPTFSLIYISMLHDYFMYRGDSNFIKNKLRISRQVLSFFHQLQQKDGSVIHAPYWEFTDWVDAPGWNSGVGPIGEDGCSAILDLQLLMAYQSAYSMEKSIGMKDYAMQYASQIDLLKKTIKEKYWEGSRKIFADTKDKKYFSQHTNALAIITGVVNGVDAHQLGEKILKDTTIATASVYFRYYLYQALTKAGFGNDYLRWLGIWKQNLKMGLTTWAETDDVNRTRSDCHAWGSSPNIELYRIVLGIGSDAPGFSKVKIEPHLGELKNVSGSMPHPEGNISASYVLQQNKWNISITLPSKISGNFIWKGKEYPLKAGENNFTIANN
ncbi:MAG: alpha-L-rhamnosidase N-terminal domain-containing protein [Bacteroidetes bacterium]|nr:alpha-L-rhamnosidase N-terminal domain-containing protein [Bacteroidota bacterium]